MLIKAYCKQMSAKISSLPDGATLYSLKVRKLFSQLLVKCKSDTITWCMNYSRNHFKILPPQFLVLKHYMKNAMFYYWKNRIKTGFLVLFCLLWLFCFKYNLDCFYVYHMSFKGFTVAPLYTKPLSLVRLVSEVLCNTQFIRKTLCLLNLHMRLLGIWRLSPNFTNTESQHVTHYLQLSQGPNCEKFE